MRRLGAFFLLVASIALPSAGADSFILIPTLYTGPGAFGSTWTSSVLIANHGPTPFEPPGVAFWILCGIPEGCAPSASIPPFGYGSIYEPRPAAGLLLHGDDAVLEDLAFHATFTFDTQSVERGAEYELPIVRESAFRRSPLRFPYVIFDHPVYPKRVALRIYGPDAAEGTTVRIEVRHWGRVGTEPADAAQELRLASPPQTAEMPIYPAYGQIMLNAEFPAESLGGSTFDIAVVPLALPSGEVPRIWAYISTTDNIRQQVTLQTPQ